MTQALLNNLNTTPDLQLHTTNQKEFANSNFQKLLDKQEIQDTNQDKNLTEVNQCDVNAGTIGAMKNSFKNALNEFGSLVSQTTQEISNGIMTDLTLEKDLETISENLETITSMEEESDSADESIQNVIQIALPIEEQIVETSQSENSKTDELTINMDNKTVNDMLNTKTEELSVIINGKTLNDVLDKFNITDTEELNVTLNGMALEDALEGFNTQDTEEMPVVNIAKTDEETDIEGKTLEDLVDEDVLKELNIESLEAETSTSEDGADLMQQQTPEEQGIKAGLNLEHNSYQEIKPAEVTATKQTTPTTDSSKLLEQISKQMDKLFNGSKLEIIMNPESLGKVSIQLINTKEGLTAQFTAATIEARNLLMKGLDGLKESLVSQGVSVDNVSVKLSEPQKSEYNSDWTEQEGSRGGNKEQEQQRGRKEEKQFENLMSKEEEK